MSRSDVPSQRRLRGLPWAMLGASLLAVLGVTPAAAHAELTASSPDANASLLEAPEQLELTFTEPIDPELAFIDLLDPSQAAVEGVSAPAIDASGRVATLRLPELEPGVYTVSYQVVSTVDGHATTGLFAFVIDPTGAEPPPAVEAASTTPAVDGWAIAGRWLALAGALVGAGSLLLWWRSRAVLPTGAAGSPPWPLVAIAAGLAFTGLAVYLSLSGRPIVDAVPERGSGFPLDFAAPFGATPFAVAMRVALAGSLLAAVLALIAWLGVSRRAGAILAGVTGVVLAATLAGMSFAAHAAAAGGPAFALVDWAHLLAVAAWLGGLPAMAILARRPVEGRASRRVAGDLLRRHGSVALIAAPLVALTGIANSPLVLGTPRDLVGSEYGNLLLAKGGLLSVALAIGAVNHFALRGRGRGRAPVIALVGAELLVAAIAVSAAATMVTIQPAAARQPVLVTPSVNPAHLFGDAGPSSIHATVNVPAPGNQTYQVTVADLETGTPRGDVQRVFLELTPPPAADLPPERVDLEPDDHHPGLYSMTGAHLSIEGEWTVTVVVRRAGALDESVSFEVPVSRPPAPQLVPPPDTGVAIAAPIGMLWGVLPSGLAGWLPAGLALAALVGLGLVASGRRSGWLTLVRGVLVIVVLVGAIGAGSRALVAASNAPTAAGLAEHQPDPSFAASVGDGEIIYRANCAACHGRDGDGDGPVRTLPPAGGLAEPVSRMSSAELSYRIANGMAGVPMPAFAATLTAAERWHLVRYLEERWRQR